MGEDFINLITTDPITSTCCFQQDMKHACCVCSILSAGKQHSFYTCTISKSNNDSNGQLVTTVACVHECLYDAALVIVCSG